MQEEIGSGHFHSVDELIVQGVYALREKSKLTQSTMPPRKRRKNLADFLSESPFAGSEIDLERQRDYGRPVDLRAGFFLTPTSSLNLNEEGIPISASEIG